MIKVIKGGVTAPQGFLAAGVCAGVKAGQDRRDMAMIYTKEPAVCAGTFTRNIVKAAPVFWDRDITEGPAIARAVVVNSGVANACTGKEGLDNCAKEAEKTAFLLGIGKGEVLVA